MSDVAAPFTKKEKKPIVCSHCGHPTGVLLDVFCCPAGVTGRREKSPHCLWCGDDLSTTRSFCNHTCSTSYHLDLSMTSAFLQKRTG